MADVCGTCLYVEKNNYREHSSWGNEWRSYHCQECGGYHKEDEKACRHYQASLASQKSNDPGCFITTIVVNTLGYDDDCIVLRTLRKFRKEILQPDEAKRNILIEYDLVGPQIRNAIINDSQKDLLCHYLMIKYLIPITKLIRNHEDDKAIQQYEEMVMKLKFYYKVTIDCQNYSYLDNVEVENMGKGLEHLVNINPKLIRTN